MILKKLRLRVKKFFKNLVFLFLFLYLSLLITMYFLQEKFMFFPKKMTQDFAYSFDIPFEEKFFQVKDLRIHSLYFKTLDPKGLILYFHGNGCELSQCALSAVELVKKTGWDVFIIDYPGYGKSEGDIKSQEQLELIARHALNEASAYDFKKIVVLGRSLGSGLALGLAYYYEQSQKIEDPLNPPKALNFPFKFKKAIDAIILETPYFSIRDLALAQYPFVPAFLLKYPFRSDLIVSDVRAPIFIVHGVEDALIPIDHALRLKGLNQNITLVKIPKGTHDDLATFPIYWTELNQFLNSL